MSIDNNPVVPMEASAVNTEASTPRGRAAPVKRPGSQRSNHKPYEVPQDLVHNTHNNRHSRTTKAHCYRFSRRRPAKRLLL